MRDITFRRVGSGPILTPDDLPFHTDGVFNPGVAELDGEVVLLLRIEDRQGISQIRVARSRNGVDGWQVEGHPLLEPDLPDFPFEEWGCEDSRVTHMADGSFAIAYTAYSRYGPAVALATTQDFTSVERIGVVLSPTNKDAAVFPRSFQDTWLMLHRPAPRSTSGTPPPPAAWGSGVCRACSCPSEAVRIGTACAWAWGRRPSRPRRAGS